jgi:predicted transcriptional regulator
MCFSERTQILREILSYLVEYPDAQDTVEGIVEWWVLDQEIKRHVSEVKEALTKLVSEGLLIEKQGPDSRTHYLVNRRRLKRIKDMIKVEYE